MKKLGQKPSVFFVISGWHAMVGQRPCVPHLWCRGRACRTRLSGADDTKFRLSPGDFAGMSVYRLGMTGWLLENVFNPIGETGAG